MDGFQALGSNINFKIGAVVMALIVIITLTAVQAVKKLQPSYNSCTEIKEVIYQKPEKPSILGGDHLISERKRLCGY